MGHWDIPVSVSNNPKEARLLLDFIRAISFERGKKREGQNRLTQQETRSRGFPVHGFPHFHSLHGHANRNHLRRLLMCIGMNEEFVDSQISEYWAYVTELASYREDPREWNLRALEGPVEQPIGHLGYSESVDKRLSSETEFGGETTNFFES